MTNYLTDTISLPEVIWTVVTFIGVVFNTYLLKWAVEDVKALRRAGINSLREYAAISNMISEALRFFIQVVFFLVGVISMSIPPANRASVPTFQWVVTVAFVCVAVLLALASYLDKQRREHLIEMIRKLEEGF